MLAAASVDRFAPRGRASDGAVAAGELRACIAVERRVDEVHLRRAEEAGDEAGRRPLEQLERRALLLDLAVAHEHDPVGERHRLDLVVGDVDHGRAELLVQPLDLAAHLVAELGVEVGQRLVEQEELRRCGRWRGRWRRAGAGRRRAGAGMRSSKLRDAEHVGRSLDARLDLGLRRLARPSPKAMFSRDRHVRIERVVLEHHGDVAVARAHVVDDLAADLDEAAVGLLEPGDGAEQRRLPAARRADEHGELAGGDVERYPFSTRLVPKDFSREVILTSDMALSTWHRGLLCSRRPRAFGTGFGIL